MIRSTGPKNASVMVVVDTPGKEECNRGRVFSGQARDNLLTYTYSYGIDTSSWYMTALQKHPDAEADWGAMLRQEIAAVNPATIIPMGRRSAELLLNEPVHMDRVHGMVFDCGSRKIIPVINPSTAMAQERYQSFACWDFKQLALHLFAANTDRPVLKDVYAGREDYRDVTGKQLVRLIKAGCITPTYAMDTEGNQAAPWSIQVSSTAGTGYTLRCSQPDFSVGIEALRQLSNDASALVIIHHALHDIPMARVMGLELSHVPIFDTMYAAYSLRFEAQGLKPGAFRFAGMAMKAYADLVAGAGREKQIAYLEQASALEIPRPEKREVRTNNGTMKSYHPMGVASRVNKMLARLYDGEELDILDAWYKTSGEKYAQEAARESVAEVEAILGPMPEPTLDDIDLADAIHYASRDPDATIRIYEPLVKELEAYDLTTLMQQGMDALPVAEEVQATGMPVDREYFENLSADVVATAHKHQDDIIKRFVPSVLKTVKVPVLETYTTKSGKLKTKIVRVEQEQLVSPGFNPGSAKQVATMLKERKLKALKTTPSGEPSTNAKSIGYLEDKDPFVQLLFLYRRHMHIDSSFCRPVLQRTANGETFVHAQWQITRTTSRRYATSGKSRAGMSGFNLMNIPARTELGMRVRKGYIAPEGYRFLSVDYGKIEPRCLAHLSKDRLMCDTFHEGRNIYKELGARCFDIAVDELTPEQYTVSKTLFLGQAYGMGANELRDNLWAQGLLHWTLDDCEKLIASFWDTFSGAAEYKQRVADNARKVGHVRCHWGMYRYLPNLRSKDKQLRAAAERHAVSHKVQPMAQGMLQNATARLWRKLRTMRADGYDVRLCLQMHDEIVALYHDVANTGELLESLITDSFINHSGITLDVPVVVDAQHGKCWGDLKG